MNYLPHMQVYLCYGCAEARRIAPSAKIRSKQSAGKMDKGPGAVTGCIPGKPHYFPFVCNQGDILKATSVGLFCPRCEQLLKWAYPWTLDWSWKEQA